MQKKKDVLLKDYVKGLSEEELRFICSRLSQRLGGDVGEATEFLQTNLEIDELLQTAEEPDHFYDLLDEIFEYSDREFRKRVNYD